MEKLYDIPTAAQMLGGVSHWTVRAWLREGRLTPTRVGGRVMLSERELDRFLREEQTRPRKKRVLAPRGKANPKHAVASCSP